MAKFVEKISITTLVIGLLLIHVQAGIIKDIFQKVTNTNNKTEETVRESAPICGHGLFSTPNERDLSPEIIFITNQQSRAVSAHERSHQNQDEINEVAKEFRFHPENVTLRELEEHGFNPDAPVSFLMHGFTSGYPLQAWISAIVEAYTIDRETSGQHGDSSGHHDGHHHDINGDHHETYENSDLIGHSDRESHSHSHNSHSHHNNNPHRDEHHRNRRQQDGFRRNSSSDRHRGQTGGRTSPVKHNLFIINWNYAARGIIYPRAVANIPIVASYVTRFINEKLIDEAHVEPRRIQLIGHSLGAHLAGFIGKNTRSKVGRIYGLDPAGPCFGTISGPLYPASKRLAPNDAEEVITIQTNSALLGIERPLGKYSVYVEGGANQPGCKSSGVLRSLGTLTWDGGDFDTVACSHSRAPNLITYRHDQKDSEENCLMVAYACKDWESFTKGQCGVCDRNANRKRDRHTSQRSPLDPVDCLRIGLDWQYPNASSSSSHGRLTQKPGRDQLTDYFTTRRPHSSSSGISGSRRPFSTSVGSEDRNKRAAKPDDEDDSSSYSNSTSNSRRRERDEDVEPIQMFLRTSDTQPYCAFHYQLVLELNEPFEKKNPPMSIILQDSESDKERRRGSSSSRNSVSSDTFGSRFDDRTYTHLLTSYRKLRHIDHGTLILRDGMKDGHRILKALHVNYMSSPDPELNRRLSTRLCPVKTNTDRAAIIGEGANRFYFKPCNQYDQYGSSSHNHYGSDHSDTEGH
uniref:Lipase member H n=1 Tax=Aceria tosichella TaxID=561515 RepID=A0A6G1SK13_9ACAR